MKDEDSVWDSEAELGAVGEPDRESVALVDIDTDMEAEATFV